MIVRKERSEDIEAIRVLNDTAFGGSTEESSIVDRLRSNSEILLSLVATNEQSFEHNLSMTPKRYQPNHHLNVK